MVRLTASMDAHTIELRRRNDLEQRMRELSQHVSLIPQITLGQLTASVAQPGNQNALDVPNLMGPRTGKAWDIHRYTCSAFTGGTVSIYLDAIADGGQVMVFTAAGVSLVGKNQGFVPAGSRLIAAATGLVGTATLAIGGVVEIDRAWVADYLL
jgi:hypothetical protein